MAKHRRLRPWVWSTIEIMLGVVFGIAFLFAWIKVIYCITGFDLMWILEAL